MRIMEFDIGEVYNTEGSLCLNQGLVFLCLFRHAHRDYGEIKGYDAGLNDAAILKGEGKVTSKYIDTTRKPGIAFYIITEFNTEGEPNTTTVLLESEN